ncbi:MAG: hypothetical protein OEY45_02555 [Gammaproteobacteria bacterium]|nr:hypothetical protein [Gammaproteobacteria bacterium]
MADILRFRKPTAAERAKGNTLCRRGFHKWTVDGDTTFDSKQGRLVTRLRCERCGAFKTQAQ